MLAIRPLVVDYIDTAMQSGGGELLLENVKVGVESPLLNKTVAEGQRFNGETAILVVRKTDGTVLTNPPQDTPLNLEDELVIIGTREQLRALEGLE
jgi:Trk K+ transport system NAD-binding subunit